jgi:hypothetical protein
MSVRPPSVSRAGALAALAFGALTLGCASRAVPKQFPATSAASPASREAEPAAVTSALDADPPLPGTETAQWPGLRAEVPAAQTHGGHHGHH